MTRFFTRKDLARLLEVSVDTIANNERRLGLDRIRQEQWNGRKEFVYEAAAALRELRRRNQLP